MVQLNVLKNMVPLLNYSQVKTHISQIANERIDKVEDVLKVGDTFKIKVTEIDKQGRVNASHKALLSNHSK